MTETEKSREITVSEQSPADALEIIQSRNLLFDRIMAVAIKSTSATDWIDQNGKPYLQGSGAEKVARRFGVKIFDTAIEREDLEDEKGKYYFYTCTGKAALSERDVIEAIGTCSSRDPFFSHGGKLGTADVDIGNIKKSAYTNFLGNAITRLLGIRNLTWETLANFGVTRNGKLSVAYDKGASKASSTKKADNTEKSAKIPFWTSEYNGKTYLFARVGQHFDAEFLKNLGFKQGKSEGTLNRIDQDDIRNALRDEYDAAEEAIAMRREEGTNATRA